MTCSGDQELRKNIIPSLGVSNFANPAFCTLEDYIIWILCFLFRCLQSRRTGQCIFFIYSSDLGGAWLVFPSQTEVCLWVKEQKQ